MTPTYTEVARVFVSKYAADTIFTRAQWHRYAGGMWTAIKEFEFRKLIWDLLESYEATQQVRPSDSWVRNVEKYAISTINVADYLIDQHPDLVNLQNGVFNLADGILYPHDAQYYLTTQLPFDYESNAIAPEWDRYLKTALIDPATGQPDQQLIDFIQEAIGYSLTTDISHHVMFWLLGEGSNGKGVLFSVLEALAGNAAMALNLDTLRRDKYQLASMAGKRIALCPESSASDNLVDDGTIKALVSGDTINVRMIYKENFDLKPTAKLWWAMNKIPAIADTSHGFWRRMKIIPFNQTFTNGNRIPDLKQRLYTELPGIFNWAVKGLMRLRKNGKFTEVRQVEDMTAKYQFESNPVAMFVDERYYPDPAGLQQTSLIFDEYKNWCFTNGYKFHSNKNFKREMERLRFYAVRRNNGIYFAGLSKKP